MARNRPNNSKGVNIDEEKRVDNRLKDLLYELNPQLRQQKKQNYKRKKR